MIFRIYYGDGTWWQGDTPEDIERKNDVQCIAWNDPVKGNLDTGRVVYTEWDIYMYSDHIGGWHCTNKYADLLWHLAKGIGPGGVRQVMLGSLINTEDYQEILKRASLDPGLDRKSAKYPILEDGRS
jgi:hypothetical protein